MTDTLIARAQTLSDAVAERSEELERNRALAPDLAKRFAEAGLFRMLVPQCYGGGEAHPRTLVEVLETLARGDGSAAWCAMVGATTGVLAASLPAYWAQRIYGDAPETLVCGVTAPFGKARSVDGGFRVSGRWPFASGSTNAQWLCGGVIVDADNAAEGPPPLHLMLFEREQVTIHDTWHVSGLCGTGSHDIEVVDAFVPAGCETVLGGPTEVRTPLYRFPTLGLLAIGVASVTLGIARQALDAFTELAAGKTPTGSRRSLADRPAAQTELACATAGVRSARAYLDSAIDSAWARAADGEPLTIEDRAELRLASAHATAAAAGSIDRVYQAAGGSAIYASSPLQRCFRDVHTATQHMMVASTVFEITGRVLLGRPPGSVL